MSVGRRAFLGSIATLVFARLPGTLAEPPAQPAGLAMGTARPFSFAGLVARAKSMSMAAYEPPERPAPAIVQRIDYDALGKIHYRRDHALFADGSGRYPVTFFPLGRFFPNKVRMFAVDGDESSEILYAPGYFDMPQDSVARDLPKDAGFTGFRLHESHDRVDWRTQDWLAFLGASYFRAIGALGQYGLSARGIAVDTAAPKPEEFPAFVEFHIAPAHNEDAPVVICALLDGPSIAGAFRFEAWRRDGVIMTVESRLFLRRDVSRLGIAPLTSMFWYAELDRPKEVDWRPEVHDSDGLAVWTGGGERLWRQLMNSKSVVTSSFVDENPRGFGLLQRDRDVENFLDGVNYHRRPSLWVEPLDDWGRGAVQLAEIPTDDESHDNIAAFWVPEEPAKAENAYTFRYRLHWLADEPYPPSNLARVFATRGGRGGAPGGPRPEGVRKFVVEFAGGPLANLADGADVMPIVTASRGRLTNVVAEPIPDSPRWRVLFDLSVDENAVAELRMYMRSGDRPLTETWLYQYRPVPSS